MTQPWPQTGGDSAWIEAIRSQAAALIDQELADETELHGTALAAIGSDYAGMQASDFSRQLRALCLVLRAFRQKSGFTKMQGLLAELLRSGIHQIDAAALDGVTVQRDSLQVMIDGRCTFIALADPELVAVVSLSKESRETERQLAALKNYIAAPSADLLAALAAAFKLSLAKTRQLTVSLAPLFDAKGAFQRQAFDGLLDELARHGVPAFELLWCHFKLLAGRDDRILFLNALQHLIRRLDRPKHVLRFLLADYCRNPERVAASDRNAIMLVNILLRTYNKELNTAIEMTPEEVLNVRNGLDPAMVGYAQFRIDAVEYRFGLKLATIHRQLTAQLAAKAGAGAAATIEELLFLERESLILLSLLAGKTAHAVLSAALTEYGDPVAGVYRHRRAGDYLTVLLQQLIVVVRGIGRVGSQEDVDRLRQIQAHQEALVRIAGCAESRRTVARITEWVDNAIRGLTLANLNAL